MLQGLVTVYVCVWANVFCELISFVFESHIYFIVKLFMSWICDC